MQCLNDVRVCLSVAKGTVVAYSKCCNLEYVGWKNDTRYTHVENIDPRYNFHVQFCNHDRLNKAVVGGRVVYEAPLIDDEHQEFNSILEELDKGSRDVLWVEHSTYKINNR